MNIAIIAPTEIPARRANTVQVMKMAQAFSVLGHEVRLAVPSRETGKSALNSALHNWSELAHHYGLQHEFVIEWLPADSHWRRYDFSLRAVHWASDWEAGLLYTRLPQAAAIASVRGMPTILEVHDLPQGMLGPWLFQQFCKGKGAQRLVVITQALAQDLQHKLGAPTSPPFTIIAPDGVDLARYQNLPTPEQARQALNRATAQIRIQPDCFTVGYTGHLYTGRGVDLLFNLAARLPDMTFLIAGGETKDVTRLKEAANTLNLQNILLTGFVPNADLPLYQAACDVLLMPYQQRVAASSGGDISRYLSPMKLFEYMACERAIISSNLPVLQEVLNLQNAVLLPYDDLNAWEAALHLLQADQELRNRLARQARQDVNGYTWEARATKILADLI